jgi:regulatory protein
MRKPPKKLDAQALAEYAMRTLSGRALSTGELRLRLRRKAERLGDVEVVIARMRDHGYVNDKQFAETFAAARRDNQGLGRARVLRDLRARRVASGIAEHAVHNAYQETNEVELVEAYLARKYRNKDLGAELQDPKNLASAYRRLRYAGFGSSASIRVLKRYAAEAAQLESIEDSPEAESGGHHE